MKKSEATAVGFRVVGLYAFLQAILALSAPISLHVNAITLQRLQGRMGAGNYTFSAVAFVPAVLLFLFGVLLWLTAKRAEAGSLAQEPFTETATGLNPQMLQRIIFSALGILIVVESITPLVNVISILSLPARPNSAINLSFYYRLVEVLVRLILGGWLIIGSRHMQRFQAWLLDSVKSVGKKDW